MRDGYYIEAGALSRLPSLLSDGKYTAVYYLHDTMVDGLFGAHIRETVASVTVLVPCEVKENSLCAAKELAESLASEKAPLVLALGGGRVLDFGKYASYLAKAPLLLIPTALSNDGLVSPLAVLSVGEGKSETLSAKGADLLLLDTEICGASPAFLTQSGIGDVLSNASALIDFDLAVARGKEAQCDTARALSAKALDLLLASKEESLSPTLIAELAEALVLSGLAMCEMGSTRPVSGAEHLFGYALDMRLSPRRVSHGLAVALGTLAVYRLLEKDDCHLLSVLRRFGVDVCPSRLGVDENTFVKAYLSARDMRDRYTCLDELKPTEATLSEIYRSLERDLA